MTVRVLNTLSKDNSTDLEHAWRSLIPVESFTKQPEIPTPIPFVPAVGIRWGKPSDFEFDIPEKKQRSNRELVIREVPRKYFENNIIDFTEQYRQFVVGEVDVHVEAVPEPDEWPDWLTTVLNISVPPEQPTVELEETAHWIFDSGITYDKMDSNGIPIERIKVYYRFNMERYIPFKNDPLERFGERGEKPE